MAYTALPTKFITVVDKIAVQGNGLTANVRDALVSASFDQSLTEVAQLNFKFIDPNFKILSAGFFLPGTIVEFEDYRLEVASLDTGEVDGVEGFTVKARSAAVRYFKDAQGAFVVGNMSPSEYVFNTCNHYGVTSIVQPSERRAQIARDIPQPGQTDSETPSTWTTFKRLADEIGFVLFESAGVIYFAKPTWLIANLGEEIPAAYKTGDEKHWVNSIPECSKSADSKVTSVQVEFPSSYLTSARPGKKLTLSGVPLFNGSYLISSVAVDLMDPTSSVQVGAETPIDPEPHPPAPPASAGGGGGSYTLPAVLRTFSVGNVKPWVRDAASELGTIFGLKTIYGWAPGQYDHPKGLALDLMINNISNGKGVGDQIANYVIAHAARLGLTYMIWYRRSWNPSRRTWASYSGDSPHTDHVHLSFKTSHTYRRP